MNRQDFKTPLRQFTETQERYSREILEKARKVIDVTDSMTLISPVESLEKDENNLILQKYELNQRLYFSINKPDPNFINRDERIDKFDKLMKELSQAGIPVHHHGTNMGSSREEKKPGFSYWEFRRVSEQAEESETTNQATVLEICEMIANKIGVELDL